MTVDEAKQLATRALRAILEPGRSVIRFESVCRLHSELVWLGFRLVAPFPIERQWDFGRLPTRQPQGKEYLHSQLPQSGRIQHPG